MQKIPTLFVRDMANRSRVLNQVAPGCEWVQAGEGIATRKMDGTCCMVRDGKLYKRRELRAHDTTPPDFESVGHDPETGKTVGWVPVGDGPEDRWHREAFGDPPREFIDGTYELIGLKVQGNPEGVKPDEGGHMLVRHGLTILNDAPRTFDSLAEWLGGQDIEGIVWHHPDGRMAKIKLRDFGLRRGGCLHGAHE